MYLHHPSGHQLPVNSHQTPILEGCDPESPHWDHLHSWQVDVLPEDKKIKRQKDKKIKRQKSSPLLAGGCAP